VFRWFLGRDGLSRIMGNIRDRELRRWKNRKKRRMELDFEERESGGATWERVRGVTERSLVAGKQHATAEAVYLLGHLEKEKKNNGSGF